MNYAKKILRLVIIIIFFYFSVIILVKMSDTEFHPPKKSRVVALN